MPIDMKKTMKINITFFISYIITF